jgi:Mn2+/Fe2+ NRAMP family transporter
LDPEDLAGITPVVNREWVRLAVLGGVVVGAGLGANLLGVPDSASGPLIGIVSLITVGVLYGARLVGTDLIDVMRGQSRK